MSTGSIQTDQLFKGLTRPAMLFGVSYMFAILNVLICMVAFIGKALPSGTITARTAYQFTVWTVFILFQLLTDWLG